MLLLLLLLLLQLQQQQLLLLLLLLLLLGHTRVETLPVWTKPGPLVTYCETYIMREPCVELQILSDIYGER